jgi:hypothetical protein
MFGQSLLSAFGSAACTTDTNQLFTSTAQAATTATYELNGNVNSIGNVYNGTVSSGTAAYTTGVFGQAADFSNWNISVPNLAADLQSTAFSISFWATPGNSTSYYLMAAGSSGGTRKGFLIGTTNGTLNIRFNNLTTNYFDITASMPSGFNHYVCSFDNTTNANGAKIYVNGVLTTQGTSTGLNNFTFSTSTFFIGSEPTDSGQGPSYTSSNLDQLRIFKSAISQDVVTALYNETTTTAQSASVDYQLANPNSIAYYKMSNATDQLGNYNGTASNVNFNTEGKFGFAGAFNGSSSKVVLPDAVSSSIATASAFTISMWFNISGGSGRRFLYFFGRSTYIYLEVESDNTLRAVVNASGGSVAIDDSTVLSNNVWYNAILTGSNAANLTLYLNGSSVGTASWDGTFGAASGVAVNIGNENNALYFNGSIDQVRIYNAAVSAANVTTLYNEIECPAVAVTNAFNTVIYTGNGSTQSITSLDFQPDLVWTKQRSSPNRDHQSNDSVRGANKILYPNLSVAEDTAGGVGSAYFNSFDSNGFTVGSSPYYNGSGLNYVTWNWKAGGTAVSNTDGTITSQVSANVDAGFSIVEWSSSGGVGTVGHGLNEVPQLIIIKKTASSSPWSVYAAPVGNDKRLQLNESAAAATDSIWNNTTPTNKVFTEQISGGATTDNIAYCFHSVAGYSRIGSYVGNRPSTNTIVTGFRPAFVMIKDSTSSGEDWIIVDNKREGVSAPTKVLYPSTSGIEDSYTVINFTSNGFTVGNTGLANTSGATIIYMAIA